MSVATIDRATVFAKTAQGRAAIGHRPAGMSALYRQVLIVIDGRRDVEAVAALFPNNDFAEVAAALWREGFIGLASENSRAAVDTAPQNSGLDSVDFSELGQAKDVMATSAKECIGLLADQLIVRIEEARTLDELAVVAGQWHMALRDSKRGKSLADELLDRVRRLLNEAPEPVAA